MQMECRVSACASLPFILFLAALGWSSRKNTLDAAGNASLTIRAIDWNAFELLLFALVASQYHQHQLRTAYAGPKYDSTRALPMLYVNIPCYRGILSTFRPWSRVRTCAGCWSLEGFRVHGWDAGRRRGLGHVDCLWSCRNTLRCLIYISEFMKSKERRRRAPDSGSRNGGVMEFMHWVPEWVPKFRCRAPTPSHGPFWLPTSNQPDISFLQTGHEGQRNEGVWPVESPCHGPLDH
jgi:hypothetical protein